MATQAWVNSLGLATEAWVALEGFATEAWVALNYYNKTKYDSDLGTVAASIIDNLGLIGDNADAIDAVEADMVIANQGISDAASAISALDGRISGIENDYETHTDANSAYFSLQTSINTNIYAIGDNEDDISDLDGRLDTIELDYATQTWVDTNYLDRTYFDAFEIATQSDIADVEFDTNANTSDISTLQSDLGFAESDISDNASDISGLDGRVEDIEGDYTTEMQAYQQGSNAYDDSYPDDLWTHEHDCSCYNTC